MSGKVGVLATVTPSADKVEEVRKGLNDLAAAVKENEPGCNKYIVVEEVTDGKPLFYVIEEYADEAAYNAHMTSDYFKSLGATIKEQNLLGAPLDIKKIKAIGGFESK